MEQPTSKPAWMNDPSVKNIPADKLDFLSGLFQEGKGKTQKEMMAFFLPMMKKAKAANLNFTPTEIAACIQAIKKHSTQEELSQIDKLLKQHKN